MPAVQADVQRVVPFLCVSDLARSLHFYVEQLRFQMSDQWVDDGTLRWCRLELGGAALMLQEFPREGHDSWSPRGIVGEGVSLYFICADALAMYRHLVSCGVPATRPFVGNRFWVTTMTDPDGYRLAFESPTDQPEGIEYDGDAT